ncbi:MAG: hypothetical protein K1W16_14580 [Lachnospiraceae bacterium]
MEWSDGYRGTSELASVLCRRMKKENDSPLILDFGEIQTNGSLVTNTFSIPIPKGDYSVCRSINGYTLGTSESSWIGHLQEDEHIHDNPSDFSGHSHDVLLPKLKAGDRVLVAWVQSEAVVIDVIERA